MPTVPQSAQHLRFGDFEYDPDRRELRKHGVRVRLQPQPLSILLALLESPGSVVAREELRKRLWGSDTFVEFEQGLNSAIKRLRDALCDSADLPGYIETVPGEGYRFIGQVEKFTLAPAAKTKAAIPLISAVAPVSSPRRRWGLQLWVICAAGIAAVAIAFATILHFQHQPKAGLSFQARDWVLITSFENRTGEPVFDGTLEYALERELSNSQYVNVVPRERVDDVLRLMRKPLDTKVDAALGREICLRDGDIPALLTGRVEKLGSTYVLSATLMDTSRGVPVASLSEEDRADSQMAAAIRRLSDRVRETLGEEHRLIQQSDKRLEKVTTHSLHALQLYSQANELMLDGTQLAAAELLKQAIAEDPRFASAHLLLAYIFSNTGRLEEGRVEFQSAFDLADATSNRERLFIVASYYENVERDRVKAIENYEALLQLYPSHYWATNNLLNLYFESRRINEAARLSVRFADFRPGDLWINERAAWAMAIVEKDWKGAQPYIQRSSALVTAQGKTADPVLAAWIGWFPGFEQWLQGNTVRAHADLLQFEQTAQVKDPVSMGLFFLAFGELAKAESYFQADLDPSEREQLFAITSFIRGNWMEVKKHLRRADHIDPRSSAAVLMARAGYFNRAEQILRDPPPGTINPVIVKGELALARGDSAQAARLFEQALTPLSHTGGGVIFFGCESLARIYMNQGRFQDALHVLQQASDKKPQIYSNPIGGAATFAWNWMRTELQLADLYRKMGRVPDAERVEEGLSKLLIYADPDHPILLELRKRFHTPAVIASN